jgi:peptide/nickel transport system substrate-binding protein
MPGAMASLNVPCLESLVWHNVVTGEYTPWLAESWEEDPNGKFVILKLRKGVKFHDGTDFNARAVKDYLELKRKDMPGWLGSVSSIDIIDEHTVRLNTTRIDLVIYTELQEYMASPTHLAKGKDAVAFHPVGTGPFKFADFKRDVHLKYERFDDYWGGKPYLDAVEFVFVPDTETALAALLAGEAEIIGSIQFKDIATLERAGFNFIAIQSTQCLLAPDTANPDSIYANKKVREAVEYAIDRKEIAKSLGYGHMQPMDLFAPSNVDAYIPGLGRQYDPGKARKLLEEAGYPNGFETKIVANPFAIRDVIVAVQGYLAKVGIIASVDFADMGRYTSLRNTGWKNTLFYVHGVYGQPLEYYTYRTWGRVWKDYVSVARPEGFYDLIDKMVAETDAATRKPMLEQLVKLVHDDATLIPLVTWEQVGAISPRVHDIDLYQEHMIRWHIHKTWLSK